MSIIGWIIFGLIAGFIASKIVNKQGEGLIMDMVLGIIGAVVGGYLVEFFTGHPYASGFNIPSMIVAIIGAIIVLFLYHTVFGRRSTY
jgi:uncharacterized membrane protein YeaQ/YmgE (transglycosylase-associated protein family)